MVALVGLTASTFRRGDVSPRRGAAREMSDTAAVDQIAALLADTRWDCPADFLEAIAALVALTGRPHPGAGEPRFYGVDHVPND